MERGEFIGPELKRAIRESKIAVVLLSKNYASSSWCFDELVEIMKNKLVGQTVITIFYAVDPTDVKKQKGDFGKVFKRTCKGKDKEKVQAWRKALEGVATITGYHLSKGVNEATMIENIAGDISNKLNYLTPSRDFDHLIGMEGHMERMKLLLRLDLDEVRMIGIWGPPGIGKSTIARFLFDQLCSGFQNRALMVNIKASYPMSCLDENSAQLQLQKQMLSEMINHEDIRISHLGVAQARLRHRTVLLILDDVDRLAQLEALAKNVQWFGPRSRVIITTEDLKLFRQHGIHHVYEVNFPSTDEALQMFCMYAFDQKSPKDGYGALAREITYLVGELPLGLKVMGSYFRGLSREKWSMEVSRLRTNLNGDIKSVLKFSYDGLCDEDKDLFLHVACDFRDKPIEYVERFRDLSGRLYVLEEKSLISLVSHNDDSPDYDVYIRMHKLLAQLGKEIVRKDGEPGQRKFLSNCEDICDVISTGYTTSIRSVAGTESWYQLNITEKAFEGMINLQYLSVGGQHGGWGEDDFDHPNIILSGEPLTITSPKLRFLEWPAFQMTGLRFTKDIEFLVKLIMPRSKLEKLWDGIKLLRNLERMDLSDSKNLKELPNLSKANNLREINVSGCTSLVELPSSIRNATYLRKLDLSGCSSLVELPSSIGNLTNLQQLYLNRCSSLVELPSSIWNLTNLQNFVINGCSNLVELPSSLGNETKFTGFYLRGCSSLVELPSYIGNLTNLKELFLKRCTSLVSLPPLPDSLTHLDAENCESLEKLDGSFCNPDIKLNFTNCLKLNKEARDLIIQTSTLNHVVVVLPGKEVPAYFAYRAYGSSVTMKLNQKPLRTSTKFKACILLADKGLPTVITLGVSSVSCRIFPKFNRYTGLILAEHLYIFEFEAKEVTSTELVFDFEIHSYGFCSKTGEIKECGIIHLLEHGDEDVCERRSDQLWLR